MSYFDLTYSTSGIVTRFMPETEAGKSVWDKMNAADGNDVVFTMHLNSVLRQLRAAGYSVGKARMVKESNESLLAQLGL